MAHPNRTLFWCLFSAGALAVLFLWIPQFSATLSSFTSALTTQKSVTADQFWGQVQESRETFDNLMRTTPPQPGLTDSQAAVIAKEIEQKEEKAQKDTSLCTGTIVERTGPGTLRYSVCVFTDTSECEMESLRRAECAIGSKKKAEIQIGTLPDLRLEVTPPTACTRQNASGDCIARIGVTNHGRSAAPDSQLYFNTKFYPVPVLAPGEAYTALTDAFVARTPATSRFDIKADGKNTVLERYEDNNSYPPTH